MILSSWRSVFIGLLVFAVHISEGLAEDISLDFLSRIHAIAVERAFPPRLFLATQQGLFVAGPDGLAADFSQLDADMPALAVHPTMPGLLYASVRSGAEKSVGVISSFDSGHGWKVVGDGAGGPSGFASMDVSKADPDLIYGFSDVLKTSRDGGATWKAAASPPGRVTAIAASAHDAATVYAASSKGLYVSRDGGAAWTTVAGVKGATTSVHVAADGRVYAFIQGAGLIWAKESDLAFSVLAKDFDGYSLTALVVDPVDPSRLYAVVDTGNLVYSGDGGRTWTGFAGSLSAIPAIVEKGKGFYVDKCQECHGVDGVGEKPDDIYAKDENGLVVAPPMDDSGHAWHHSDDALAESIRKGSPNNPRMAPWDRLLSFEDTRSVIAYIKSLWSFRSHACQGARHMACMGH